MTRRWAAAVVAATAMAAHADIPVGIAVEREEGYRHVWLLGSDARGRIGWRHEVGKEERLVSVPGPFAAIRLEWERNDRQKGSEQVALKLGDDVLFVAGFASLPNPPSRPSLRVDYRLRPPPGLRVLLSHEDNSTGMAQVTLENSSASAWLVSAVAIAATGARADFEWGFFSAASPGTTVTFDLESSTCALALPRGTFRRIIQIDDLSESNRHVEFEFPFVATPGAVHVVLPDVPFGQLRVSTATSGVMLLSEPNSAEVFAVCEGSIVGQEQLEVRELGRQLCAGPRDGGASCTWAWQLGRDVGDLAPYLPVK